MLYDKSRLEKKFRTLGIRIIRCRFAILLLTLVVIGLAAWQLPRLSIATSIESFFVEHNPYKASGSQEVNGSGNE